MAVTRSPKYPNIALNEALAKARAIYNKEHMSAMTPQVAAEAMGYNGINGSSLKTISSLKKYGLLEGRGDDVRLSKDAQTLVIDDQNTQEYKMAIFRAATSPEIYAEIRKQFPGVASDRNISVYLEKQGFKPDAASTVAKNYRDSMALVSEIPTAYGQDEDQAQTGMSQPQTPVAVSAKPAVVAVPQEIGGAPRVVQEGNRLEISAVVDLKGLRKLKALLDKYEKVLEMFEDEGEGETTDLDISKDLKQ